MATNWNDPAERLAYIEREGFPEFKHAYAKHMATAPKGVAAIGADDIGRAAYTHDVDVAVKALQDIAGIDDGGLAGVCFSGFDWNGAAVHERVDQLYYWIKIEGRYEESES